MQKGLIDTCDIRKIDELLDCVEIPTNIKNYMQRLRDTVVVQQYQLKVIRERVKKLHPNASEIVRLTHQSQTAVGNILVFLQKEAEEVDHILGLDKDF